ncbi:hypothetical protein E3983_03105 [Legionella israelensis]|uniref:Uncharacterized protein n=1 Tax=Legionella israelensis TaxID=454 RepID=A0AAX1EEF1_9GAMM|nr:hypothetical protein [Legionella israelensis]QBR83438.1 hypothetical protein E3983_03105 [Legionella israelensis]
MTQNSKDLFNKTGILKGLNVVNPFVFSSRLAQQHGLQNHGLTPLEALKIQYESAFMQRMHKKEKLIAQNLQKELKSSSIHLELRDKILGFWKLIHQFSLEYGLKTIPGKDSKIPEDFKTFIQEIYSDTSLIHMFNPHFQGAILGEDAYQALHDCTNERVILYLASDANYYFDKFIFSENYNDFKRSKAFCEFIKHKDPEGEIVDLSKLASLIEFAKCEYYRTRSDRRKVPGFSYGNSKFETHGLFLTVPPANVLKWSLEDKLLIKPTIRKLQNIVNGLEDLRKEVIESNHLTCKIADNPSYQQLLQQIRKMFANDKNILRALPTNQDYLSSRKCEELLALIVPYLKLIQKVKYDADEEARETEEYTEVVGIDPYEQRLFDKVFDGKRKWISGKTEWILNPMYGGDLTRSLMSTVPMVAGVSGHTDVVLTYAEIFDLNKEEIFKAMVANLVLCSGHSLTEVIFAAMAYAKVFSKETRPIQIIDNTFVDKMGRKLLGEKKWENLLISADFVSEEALKEEDTSSDTLIFTKDREDQSPLPIEDKILFFQKCIDSSKIKTTTTSLQHS